MAAKTKAQIEAEEAAARADEEARSVESPSPTPPTGSEMNPAPQIWDASKPRQENEKNLNR